MADQLQTLLKYSQNNPELLSKALSFAQNNADLIQSAPAMIDTLKNVMSPSGISGSSPLQPEVVESLQNVGSVDNVTESINTANTFFNIKYIIIGALVLWAIIMIAVRFTIKEENTKKDIEFVNTTLFGNNGIVPIILCIWLVSVLAVTLLPALVGVLPKISVLAEALSTFLLELHNLVTKLI